MTDNNYTENSIAEYLYDVCELYEDEDLDPSNVSEVVKRAFMSSNCDDLAWLLSEITGWPTEVMTYTIEGWGFGHHTMVRSPEGRLLDIRGWTDETKTRNYFHLKDDQEAKFTPSQPRGVTWNDPKDESFTIMLGALKARKVAPFNSKNFQSMLETFENSLQSRLSP